MEYVGEYSIGNTHSGKQQDLMNSILKYNLFLIILFIIICTLRKTQSTIIRKINERYKIGHNVLGSSDNSNHWAIGNLSCYSYSTF